MEEQYGPISRARNEFQRFVSQYDYPGGRLSAGLSRKTELSYLQDYLSSWLYRGNGVEFTGRSYETYLRIALDIADAAMQGAIDFDYTGTEENGRADAYQRQIVGIHHPDHLGSDFADRAAYEIAVCRWEHRGSGRLTPGADPGDPQIWGVIQ